MGRYVVGLEDTDRTQVDVAGGKGAQLGELTRLAGIRVPAGYCVTTEAFRRAVAEAPSIEDRLARLSRLEPSDREAIRTLSAEVRRTIEDVAIPDDLADAIVRPLARLGEQAAYAVRSSATAEDLPSASSAGLLDTYLNVVGPAAVLDHVRRCWASLFTERAVTYRLSRGLHHHVVEMAVVVQRMVLPRASGVLFTADPVTGDRRVTCIEACFGLGEGLVAGRVTPDVYRVRDGEIIERAVASERRAVVAVPGGGVEARAIEPAHGGRPVVTDAQLLRLAEVGRRIEGHLDAPQDVEWCLTDDGEVHIVQSRPITTLFPVPETDDEDRHVYVSVGHQQMMTDPMRPLGLSLWRLTSPAPMREAGGRLFVDVTAGLASRTSRARLVATFDRSDPLMGDALRTIIERDGFLPDVPDEPAAGAPAGGPPAAGPPAAIATDPAIVDALIERAEDSLAALRRDIRTRTGPALLDVVLADIEELRRILFDPRSHQVISAGMEATWWLNDQLHAWLGETNAADALSRSVPNNVTSQMGLALLDVADAIRPHPEVVAFLQRAEDGEAFLDQLPDLPGGRGARHAIRTFLDTYGMRCVGEIDITRPRWSERPTALLPPLLGSIRNLEPGAGARRFAQGQREAAAEEQDLLARLRALPDGERKAAETGRMIARVRTFTGYREYPKYHMVSRYFVYKRALWREAERLVHAGVLRRSDEIAFLTFQELRDAVRHGRVDEQLLREREAAFRTYEALSPPRVLTSEGEVVAGRYRRDDVPPDALVGLPVSSGVVEGRARVLLDVAEADLEPGDILVTAYTDPSWTPAFVTVAGLVTEVGGQMTHGAVIAREYGLPAVVGVEDATRLIADGQRIRVHGSEGYVEVVEERA